MKRSALTALILAACSAGLAPSGPATAQPAQPPVMQGKPAQPLQVSVTSMSGPLARHVERSGAALQACTTGERRTVTRGRISIRWNRDGKTLAVNVGGGSARFNRCAADVLRGSVADVTGRGGALARFTVERPVPGPMPVPPPVVIPPRRRPAPPPPAPGAINRCRVDSDCVIYFRTHACVAGDPLAVNGTKLDLARARFPVHHEACGMGGPQYERLLRMNEHRFTAACEASRCVVRDRGLHDPFDRHGL